MKYVAKTDKGKLRDNNEDFFYVSEKIPLFILADGMGGHLAGETASSNAVKIIADYFESKSFNTKDEIFNIIKEALELANKEILSMSNQNPKYSGMGTTLSLGYIFENTLIFSNIGDSRIYEFNDNKLQQLTKDDTYVNYLIELGEITEEQARVHPKRNVLTQALGIESQINIKVECKDFNESKYLFCSDGLTNMVDEKRIEELLKEKEIEQVSDILVDEALENGGVDNITLILIDTSRC